ncbi:hypothetical protein LTR10_012361 [Elasticomyces elasticus]|nr:hypothetical protein LTR10_012361 [Elasticomyces elasticus]KAK4965837.1 hypothetical protein LTR42_011851 [Elasticomyces elasticus]
MDVDYDAEKLPEYSQAVAYTEQGTPADRSLVWKQDLRIIPLCAAIYLLCYLDRSNIGNAKVLNADTGNDLLEETHMTNLQYTIALWIAILMLSWGALTMGLGGVHSFGAVTAVRFGLVYYITFWYTTEERSIRVALILASATLAGAFGGAIAYGVGHMNQTAGLSAWRWLFILEGLPSMLSSVLVWAFLPDYPETANWLSADEKARAAARLSIEGSHGDSGHMTWADAKATLTDWRLYAHYAVYFGISTPFSSLSLFTPTITAGLGYDGLQAQLMTVPPYAVAYVVTILVSWSADHFNARALHSAIFATIGALGFLVSAVLPADAYSHRYGCLIVAASGAFSCIPPLLGWLSSNLFSTAAVGLAIAMNISFGAPGQIVGVWIYKANEKTRGYPTGHWTNAALLLFVAAGCMCLLVYYRVLNGKIRATGGERLYKY